jgi:hypothetical protein
MLTDNFFFSTVIETLKVECFTFNNWDHISDAHLFSMHSEQKSKFFVLSCCFVAVDLKIPGDPQPQSPIK